MSINEKDSANTTESENSGKKIRILLVDDHTLFRSGLKALLQRQSDFQVVGETDNGLDGVKLAEQLQPDVVLLERSRGPRSDPGSPAPYGGSDADGERRRR